MSDESVGDIVPLSQFEDGYLWNISDTITQHGPCVIAAYLRVTVGDELKWSSRAFRCDVVGLPNIGEATKIFTPTIIDQMYTEIQTHKSAMLLHASDMLQVLSDTAAVRNATSAIKAETEGIRDAAQEAQTGAGQSAEQAAEDRADAQEAATRASESADGAEDSELSAGGSATQAAQALADLLRMLGTDIATLGADGKLTPSQIPPISINDVFPVSNTAEMLALTAERGDTAVIMAGGVVTDCYILMTDDPTTLTNWAKLGISYVANAGHAVTADSATDAERINGKRIISMTQEQFDNAVTDPDTLYVVAPEEG